MMGLFVGHNVGYAWADLGCNYANSMRFDEAWEAFSAAEHCFPQSEKLHAESQRGAQALQQIASLKQRLPALSESVIQLPRPLLPAEVEAIEKLDERCQIGDFGHIWVRSRSPLVVADVIDFLRFNLSIDCSFKTRHFEGKRL